VNEKVIIYLALHIAITIIFFIVITIFIIIVKSYLKIPKVTSRIINDL
jgi:hypothetical protein